MFNVKGEDLMWLDRPNARLTDRRREDYARLGLPAGPFESVGLWAPVRPDAGGQALPQVEGRSDGVAAYYWTVREFVRERCLRFLFAEADDERSQIADLVARVESFLDRECEDDPDHDATVVFGGYPVRSFEELCDLIRANVEDDRSPWRGRLSDATVAAFVRRLDSGRFRLNASHLIWGREAEDPARHRIDWEANQVTVVDIHNLHDRAKRFVTGVVIKRLFEHKERMGRREPLTFLVLDELNRYAPREGEVADQGGPARRRRARPLARHDPDRRRADRLARSSGASSRTRRSAWSGGWTPPRPSASEYGFLPAVTRSRASILKPGSMILQQPHIPVPIQIRFPFPAWATRADEAAGGPGGDVFEAFEGE